jgi:hypothetical protein
MQGSVYFQEKKFVQKVKQAYRKKGGCYVIKAGIKIITYWLMRPFKHLSCFYYKTFKASRKFNFNGEEYNYFYHKYNGAWANERAVEVPIIWKIIKQNYGKKILEIGNVLSHYFPVSYDILDKYEKTNGVINEDVVYFETSKKYDLIVSISTLEHVGWDEQQKEPKKILFAIDNIKKLLTDKGQAVVTLPIGYNHDMDGLLKSKELKFTKEYYLKRISKDNIWIEAKWEEIKDLKYGTPFPAANGLIIGFIEKK